MYKPEPPDGWMLLDEYYSPGGTARYVRSLPGNRRAVVDVHSSGYIGEYTVRASIESGVLEPYQEGERVEQLEVASNVDEEKAFEIARQEMTRTSGSGLFDQLF